MGNTLEPVVNDFANTLVLKSLDANRGDVVQLTCEHYARQADWGPVLKNLIIKDRQTDLKSLPETVFRSFNTGHARDVVASASVSDLTDIIIDKRAKCTPELKEALAEKEVVDILERLNEKFPECVYGYPQILKASIKYDNSDALNCLLRFYLESNNSHVKEDVTRTFPSMLMTAVKYEAMKSVCTLLERVEHSKSDILAVIDFAFERQSYISIVQIYEKCGLVELSEILSKARSSYMLQNFFTECACMGKTGILKDMIELTKANKEAKHYICNVLTMKKINNQQEVVTFLETELSQLEDSQFTQLDNTQSTPSEKEFVYVETDPESTYDSDKEPFSREGLMHAIELQEVETVGMLVCALRSDTQLMKEAMLKAIEVGNFDVSRTIEHFRHPDSNAPSSRTSRAESYAECD